MRKRLRILIVDADLDSADLLVAILQMHDIETEVAFSVHQALEEVEQWCPEMVCTEIALPHEDGYHLLRHMRQLKLNLSAPIPVIAVTTRDRELALMLAPLIQFDHWLRKPIDWNEVIGVIDRAATCSLQIVEPSPS